MSKKGSCLCGSVSYRFKGPTQSAHNCNCQLCTSAFSLSPDDYVLIEPDSFKWLSGEDLLSTYTSANGSAIQSCRSCSTVISGSIDGLVHGVTKHSLKNSST